ncbi:MAG: efflux RND transporter periplasmic adaptor subunit [Candidatus Sumerlaea chitinivorans]|nr:efflux RND transporter periplasmic adaptor subunit [Candidatus Sumerlaea chitinivorans]
MNKGLKLLGIGVVAAAVVGYVVWGRGKTAPLEPTEKESTVKVERGTIELRVATTGKVVSNLDVAIKSKASGQIIKLPYDISDRVTSGALLAELDPVDEIRNVTQKEAALASARARLAQAKEEYQVALVQLETGTSSALAELAAATIKERDARARLEREEELYAKGLTTKESLDAARSEAASAANALRQAQVKVEQTKNLPRQVEMKRQDVLLAEADVKKAEVDLQNAQQRLRETKIFAPMDGVITTKEVQIGQIIASGISNVGGGTTLMTLSDLSRIFVNANVDESDIGKVKLGQRAIITADAYPGKRFRGKVVRIATKGTNNNNVVTFEVKIEVEGEGKELLKPEMTANVEIQADRRENVLTLPNEAVQFGKQGYFVEMKSKDDPTTTVRQKIETGITDGLVTEIVSGLNEGDEVLVPSRPQSRWTQGMAGAGQQRGSQNFDRGMRMATFRMSGAGRGR